MLPTVLVLLTQLSLHFQRVNSRSVMINEVRLILKYIRQPEYYYKALELREQ